MSSGSCGSPRWRPSSAEGMSKCASPDDLLAGFPQDDSSWSLAPAAEEAQLELGLELGLALELALEPELARSPAPSPTRDGRIASCLTRPAVSWSPWRRFRRQSRSRASSGRRSHNWESRMWQTRVAMQATRGRTGQRAVDRPVLGKTPFQKLATIAPSLQAAPRPTPTMRTRPSTFAVPSWRARASPSCASACTARAVVQRPDPST
mmetsp:Transcript_9341/g.34971  ORF Transcript_9341/g.34971 Transcript_9341/m.34971 type:complete len:207 (-) Transcript_9341:2727-3347(-)